jgi:hypothetical protein
MDRPTAPSKRRPQFTADASYREAAAAISSGVMTRRVSQPQRHGCFFAKNILDNTKLSDT